MATRMAGIRKREPIRNVTGSPICTDASLLDVDALDARPRGAGTTGRCRTTSAGRSWCRDLGFRPALPDLVLVDHEQSGQQLLLGGEQVPLGLGRDHVTERPVDPPAKL